MTDRPQDERKGVAEECGEAGPADLHFLLESRHETMLQWHEPWQACGPEGNELSAHVVLRATVHDCINLQRRAAKAAGRPTHGDDGDRLLDFIATHWAQVVAAEGDARATAEAKDLLDRMEQADEILGEVEDEAHGRLGEQVTRARAMLRPGRADGVAGR